MNSYIDHMNVLEDGNGRVSLVEGARGVQSNHSKSDFLVNIQDDKNVNDSDHYDSKGLKRSHKSDPFSVGHIRSERVVDKLQREAPMTGTIQIQKESRRESVKRSTHEGRKTLQAKRKLPKRKKVETKRCALKASMHDAPPNDFSTTGKVVNEKENGGSNQRSLLVDLISDFRSHSCQTSLNEEDQDRETPCISYEMIPIGQVVETKHETAYFQESKTCCFLFLRQSLDEPDCAVPHEASFQTRLSANRNGSTNHGLAQNESSWQNDAAGELGAGSLDALLQLPRDASYLFSPLSQDFKTNIASCKFYVRKFSGIDFFDIIVHCLEPCFKQQASRVQLREEPVVTDITDQEMVEFLEDVLWTGGKDNVVLTPLAEIHTPDFRCDSLENILTLACDPLCDIWVE